MRKIIPLNSDWSFYKSNEKKKLFSSDNGEKVCIPHTWNMFDGQDGGFDYLRTKCTYVKTLKIDRSSKERVYLDFGAVSMKAEVFVNGKLVFTHAGGFSGFRCDITDYLKGFGKNEIRVTADNSESTGIYPQTADFTFFGGIYRNVNIIIVPPSHFDLDYFGSPGIEVTPVVNSDGSADVKVKAYVTNALDGQKIRFTCNGNEIFADASDPAASFHISEPHLWHGVADPYLYKLNADLTDADGSVLDSTETKFGIRTFNITPDNGFYLNGKKYPLHGVSRHQDRIDRGWAISEEFQIEDIKLIREVGANTIRLAHYQHSQFFYDLCDEYGLVVWAEVPFISSFMDTPEAHDNILQQMKELIIQSYNHPSIVCWGIANEITIGGEAPALIKTLHELNDLCHELDKTRVTTMAQLSMVENDSPLNRISDVVSYNHYFGWYMGEVADNGPWLDAFHKENPDICLGVSEYGCEGIISLHSSTPQVQDYSEEYQAYYHEEMLKTFAERPYLWSTHVWNMFDFASDMRDEGGVKGRNNKGLVTFDRSVKKDSFYIYKAYWSDVPFVHICSSRYKNRTENSITVKAYSNCSKLSLSVNNEFFGELDGDKIFVFENVPLKKGDNTVTVSAENITDSAVFTLVEEPDASYALKDVNKGESAANWFDSDLGSKMPLTFKEGYLSVHNKMGEILKNEDGAKLIEGAIDFISKEMNMNISKGMLSMIKNFTVEKVFAMAGSRVPGTMLPLVNGILQQLPSGKETAEHAEKPEALSASFGIYDSVAAVLENENASNILLSQLNSLKEHTGIQFSEKILGLVGGFNVSMILNALNGGSEFVEATDTLLNAVKK